MICDLSFPSGHSVNDGIPRDLCLLQYATVDNAVGIVQNLGRDAQLVKLDIIEAYCIVPVHPDDYHLMEYMYIWVYGGREALTLIELYLLA